MTQNERRKHEKKKQLWEQYKKKIADRTAKKKKAIEESNKLVRDKEIIKTYYLETRNSTK